MAEQKKEPVFNAAQVTELMTNMLLSRQALISKLTDPRRDIDKECGFPQSIDLAVYRQYYEREALAQRVVNLYPSDCWSMDPEVYESDDPNEETDFEQAFKDLNEQFNIFHYCHRVDELSGIGHYGVLFLGFDDGQKLDQPVKGLDERGGITGTVSTSPTTRLLYIRVLDQLLAPISELETDPTNPRFGQAKYYNLKLLPTDEFSEGQSMGAALAASMPTGTTLTDLRVHWSRVIHVADNCKSNIILGTPRMRPVFNNLYNCKKILGGSAEMFWQGGFPGYSFEVNPEIANEVEMDVKSVREEFFRFTNSLQRYLAIQGVTAKSLAPQIASPKESLMAQLQAIAIANECPLRILIGSEQAQLASGQDMRSWNKRLSRRNEKHCSPSIIKPLVQRLQAVGVLPRTVPRDVDKKAGAAEMELKQANQQPPQKRQPVRNADAPDQRLGPIKVYWPDLNTLSDTEKADVALKKTQAMAQYVSGGVNTFYPEAPYLINVLGEDKRIVDKVLEQAVGIMNDEEDTDSPLAQKQIQEAEQAKLNAEAQFERDSQMMDKKGGQELDKLRTSLAARQK